MPTGRTPLALALLLPLHACTVPSSSPPSPARADDLATAAQDTTQAAPRETGVRQRAGAGEWGERFLLDATFVPGAWLRLTTDDPANPGQEVGDASGIGYGLRVAVGNRDQSIGLLYQGFDVDADSTDALLHSLYLDFDVRVPLAEGGDAFTFVTGAGVGAAWFDFAGGNAGTKTEAAAQLRIGFAFAPSRAFAVDFGLGGLVFGHPGDTEAYGTFLTLGALLTF